VLNTKAFDAMINETGLPSYMEALDKASSGPDLEVAEAALLAVEDLRRSLVSALQSTVLPDSVEGALFALPAHTHWAVRSSATVEDNAHHSFAGQFQSHLSVPRLRLVKAVREVWASSFQQHVLRYRAQRGTDMPRMAVILQPMQLITVGDRAGVAFSQSTVPGLSGVLIQTTYGAGITVVSGRGGELKCVNTTHVMTYPQAPPEILISAAEGGLEGVPPQPGTVLSEPEAFQLAEQVTQIAEQYGGPVDVEFIWRAEDSDKPTFVQVRPLVL
jgi:pyruvate,water dikinase